jgi:hypothetical protein
MSRHVLAGLVVAVILLAGCRSPTDVSPTVVGQIVQTAADPFMILVEPGPGQCGSWFVVDSGSEIRMSNATSSTVPGDAADLQVGVKVSVWPDGELILTCPARGRAHKRIGSSNALSGAFGRMGGRGSAGQG